MDSDDGPWIARDDEEFDRRIAQEKASARDLCLAPAPDTAVPLALRRRATDAHHAMLTMDAMRPHGAERFSPAPRLAFSFE